MFETGSHMEMNLELNLVIIHEFIIQFYFSRLPRVESEGYAKSNTCPEFFKSAQKPVDNIVKGE